MEQRCGNERNVINFYQNKIARIQIEFKPFYRKVFFFISKANKARWLCYAPETQFALCLMFLCCVCFLYVLMCFLYVLSIMVLVLELMCYIPSYIYVENHAQWCPFGANKHS